MEAFLTDGAQLLEKAFWLQLLERAKLVDTSLSPTFKGQSVSRMEPVQGCFSSRLAYKEIPPTTFVPALFSKPYLPRDAWAGDNERRRFLWPRNRKALRIRTESEYKNIYVLQTEEHVLNVKQTQNTQPRSKGQAAAEDRTGGELWVPGTWQLRRLAVLEAGWGTAIVTSAFLTNACHSRNYRYWKCSVSPRPRISLGDEF